MYIGGDKVRIIKKNSSLCICTMILIIFYLQNIDKLRLPAILLDEVGYWSSAAFWNGYDWSSLMGNFSSYYSYGYGIFLYLLMKIFKDVELLHQAAIVANVVMILCGYYLLRIIIKKFYPQISNMALNIGCMIPLFYPSIQYHTQTAWSETFLFFFFLVSVLLVIKIFETGKWYYSVLLALNVVYLYMIHLRSIGVLIFTTAYILFFQVILKKNWT